MRILANVVSRDMERRFCMCHETVSLEGHVSAHAYCAQHKNGFLSGLCNRCSCRSPRGRGAAPSFSGAHHGLPWTDIVRLCGLKWLDSSTTNMPCTITVRGAPRPVAAAQDGAVVTTVWHIALIRAWQRRVAGAYDDQHICSTMADAGSNTVT